MSHLFDVHAAFLTAHQHGQFACSIEHHAKVKFTSDVATGFDDDLIALFAGGARLDRHQMVAQHVGRRLTGFLGRFNQLNAVLVAVFGKRTLAATACVNLRFNHSHLAPQFSVGIRSFFGGSSQLVFKDRHAKLFEQFLALILVNFHKFLFRITRL